MENLWHARSIDEIAAQFKTNITMGLAQQEAKQRLVLDGANVLKKEKTITALTIFLRQLKSLVIWVLIVAAIVSIGLNAVIDGFAILAIVVLNVTIGFFQEYRADKAVAALKKLAAPKAKVLRDGHFEIIPAANMVRGDVILVQGGDLVAADARLIETSALYANEASLTGESEPAEKNTDLCSKETILADQKNMIFFGTNIVKGMGRAIVVKTGMDTEVGHIANLLEKASGDETPLQRRLSQVAQRLLWICLGIVVVIFFIGLFRSIKPFELFLTAVSLAVAAIPEGLPTVVTIALALGVQRMVRRNALVRHLPAVETMECVQVICTDKTGTLTVGQMSVRQIMTSERIYTVTGEGYKPEGFFFSDNKMCAPNEEHTLLELLKVGIACNEAELRFSDNCYSIIGNPTEGAFLVAGAKAGLQREELEAEMPIVKVLPFDSDRKRMTTIRKQGDKFWCFMKGAPEMVMERCTHIYTEQGIKELTSIERARISQSHLSMTNEALRVLALAEKSLDELTTEDDIGLSDEKLEQGFIFLGLVGLQDPPRAEALGAVRRCKRAGIKTVMITGDHPNTARAIARELEIFSGNDEVIVGFELEQMSDEELTKRVNRISVYACVTAEHKLRIVRAWKNNGAVVAMTGDGVNDAPALKEAAIGIAMGITGTEVTKEAANIIITDDNFASIVVAIEEGRGIYDNIAKTIAYLLGGNSGELVVMLVGALIGWPLILLPVHLLWINLVTDGLPALALAVDPIDSSVMAYPPRQRKAQLLDKAFIKQILLVGFLTATVALGVFAYEFYIIGNLENARDAAFSTLVVAELLRAFGARSKTKTIWQLGLFKNIHLFIIVGVSFLLQVVIHHVSWLRAIFKIGPVSWSECLIWIALGCIPLLVLECLKMFRQTKGKKAL
ncbi:MAG: hypothetical protein ACD_21C00016G0008 [uncultured bacterium]|nr:MAG: hypothetical protein ACD_21C00016G0008 [uncultured bacterium]